MPVTFTGCNFAHSGIHLGKVVVESNNTNTRKLKNINDYDQFRGSWNPNFNSIVTLSDSHRTCSSANYFQHEVMKWPTFSRLLWMRRYNGKLRRCDYGAVCGGTAILLYHMGLQAINSVDSK